MQQHAGLVPYFPRNETEDSPSIKTTLPRRPSVVGPVYDTAYSKEPLQAFDEWLHCQSYGGISPTGEAEEPPLPPAFKTRYLFPTLARNERLRLTLLWYHCRLIDRDEQLLAKIDTLVKGVQKAIGWEYAIAGVLNESTYTRLAVANLPIARLPRRESTCAHTINQNPSSVFMVTDMTKDWRLQHSPHVEFGGLRSYAGTQLRLMADDGDEIALGSLCVASNTPQPPLSQDQRDFLVRFAELISSTIAIHTRQRRLKDREKMAEFLVTLQSNVGAADFESAAIELIQQAYPQAQVSLQASADSNVTVEGRPGVSVSEVHEGLWEDTEFIEHAISTSNFEELRSGQTVRAVIARCGSSDKYIVVSSHDVHYVFDDFDAWFVLRSASIIADTLQSRLLQQALVARETFLRGITHQLRTPIHGILGSAELLVEELAARKLLIARRGSIDLDTISTSPAACIATIRNSGRELMTTVNNILKHNAWASGLRRCRPNSYDLYDLEGDILPDILSLVPQERLEGLLIEFQHELAGGKNIFTTDAHLLKDCLQAIILNAIYSVWGVASGVVSVTVRSTPDLTKLMFDIVDNGCGIDDSNKTRIFEPYEKVDSHKPGAGLGLTLASKIAHTMNGTVRLVSSELGSGSHFRAEFQDPKLDPTVDSPPPPPLSLGYLTRTYHDIRNGGLFDHFVDHVAKYLDKNGFQRGEVADAAIVVTNIGVQKIMSQLQAFNSKAIIISCGPAGALEVALSVPSLIAVTGPLHAAKLDRILQQADELYKSLFELAVGKQVNGSDDHASNGNEPAPPAVTPSVITRLVEVAVVDKLVAARPLNSLKIEALLVDDNPINLRMLQMFCHKRKIPYVTAEDGNKAIEQFAKAAEAKSPITLVLMDLQMPHCDGIQATAAIRSYEKEQGLEKSCILMVTGQDSEKDETESRRAGADEFLVKPVGPRHLDKHIGLYFRSYQSDVG